MNKYIVTYYKLILIFIVFLGIFLRFYNLGSVPPGLNGDEAALGYNAYAILKTGHDEFGRRFPLNYLESYGDFKPPFYSYLTIIPVAIFSLSEFSTRFISALSGVIMIIIAFFITQEIFYKSKNKLYYGLLAALFLAISPWNINLSRAAFESNLASTLVSLGLLFFLMFINRKPFYLILSALFFSLSLVTYNSARVVVPILLIVLLVIYHKILFKNFKIVLISVIVGILIVAPSITFLLSPQASTRFNEVNIFTDLTPILESNKQIELASDPVSRILSNRRIFFTNEYLSNYLSHLDPFYLFIRGDGNPKFSTQRLGQMHFIEIFFVTFGVFILFRKRESHWFLVPIIVLIAFIPAGVSNEAPHSLRSSNAVLALVILSAYGAYWILYSISNLKSRKVIKISLYFLIVLSLFISLSYYLHDYYRHYSREYSNHWNYGSFQIVKSLNKDYDRYEKFVISDKFERSYIYFLFYNRTSPDNFIQRSKISRDQFGFVKVENMDKIVFVSSIKNIPLEENFLYVTDAKDLPEKIKIKNTINDFNNNPIFYIFTK